MRALLLRIVFMVCKGFILASLSEVNEYEVVYPHKLNSWYRRDPKAKYPEEVQYRFQVQGEHVVLPLKKNDGYFMNRGQKYAVAPLKPTYKEHALYNYENLKSTLRFCGVTNTTLKGSSADFRYWNPAQREAFLKAKKYVELYVVADTSMYKKYNQSQDLVRKKIFEVIKYINLVFKSIHIFVALTGLEIWETKDLIEVDTSVQTSLERFSAWKHDELLNRNAHDYALLFSNVEFTGPAFGIAFVGAMCSPDLSAVVIQDHSTNVLAVGTTVIHEMGHALGMLHDTKDCVCSPSPCIMSPSLSSKTPTAFSGCSLKQFGVFIKKRMPACLMNKPEATHLIAMPECGNGMVEVGEQCDCGLKEECQDVCCHAKTCKLKPHAKCSFGECCENCQIKKAGTVCRPSKNDCDLTDRCDGNHSECILDRYRRNGFPCNGQMGYCLMGTCPTLKSQCEDIWGQGAVEGTNSCFEINGRGDYYGFCTYSSDTFNECAAEDIKCGKLFCIGGRDTPTMAGGMMFIGQCKCVFPTPVYVENFAMVKNGTKCGPKMVCEHGRCVEMGSIYKTGDCAKNCTGNSVCDNEEQCQCMEGWQPPDCTQRSKCNKTSAQTDQGAHMPW
ncbi:disintegrin and metalloproteinase domain-containing protein 28-like isoform X2 [Lissotriton helveticus]